MGTKADRYEIRRSTFEEILPIWRDRLWPGRLSAIEPVSIIDSDGELSLRIKDLHPVFFEIRGLRDLGGEIVGVCSGFRTSEAHFRSRGCWVDPSFRGQGLGALLLSAVNREAMSQGCSVVWTMARHSAIGFYERCGFRDFRRIDRFEFGPHFLAQKPL